MARSLREGDQGVFKKGMGVFYLAVLLSRCLTVVTEAGVRNLGTAVRRPQLCSMSHQSRSDCTIVSVQSLTRDCKQTCPLDLCSQGSACRLSVDLNCSVSVQIDVNEFPAFTMAIASVDSSRRLEFLMGIDSSWTNMSMLVRMNETGICSFSVSVSSMPGRVENQIADQLSLVSPPDLDVNLGPGVLLYRLNDSDRFVGVGEVGHLTEFIAVDPPLPSSDDGCWESFPLPSPSDTNVVRRLLPPPPPPPPPPLVNWEHDCVKRFLQGGGKLFQVIPATAVSGSSAMKEYGAFNEIACAGRPDDCSFSPCAVAAVYPGYVQCAPGTSQSTIVSMLNLTGLGLNGSIPRSIGNMSELQELRLSNNMLSGPIPTEIVRLGNLRHLDLSSNSLSCDLSGFPFSNLTSLKSLRLDGNLDLNGTVAGFPRNLTELNVTGTRLSCIAPLRGEEVVNRSFIGCRSLSMDVQGSLSEESVKESKPLQQTQYIVLLTAACVLLLCGLLAGAHVAVFMIRRSKKRQGCAGGGELGGLLRRPKLCNHLGPLLSLSVEEIEVATEKMSRLIGRGLFGMVYDGRLPDGRRVSIKFRAKGTTAVLSDFRQGIRKLAMLSHRNLVKLVGFCDEGGYEALVFDFVPNGSISDYLHDNSKTGLVLTWQARLKILQGAAAGIDYLHRQGVIHCDVKSRNILLDDKYEAKVTDGGYFHPSLFGDPAHTDLKEYFKGYLDPEYEEKGVLDRKSDIYSFGVVMLETVSGRKALVDVAVPQSPASPGDYSRSPSLLSPRLQSPPAVDIGGPSTAASWSRSSRAMASAAIQAILMDDSGEQQEGMYGDPDDDVGDEEEPPPTPAPPPPKPIAEWVRELKAEGKMSSFIDPKLAEGAYSMQSVAKIVDIALWCVEASSSSRPSNMRQVRDKIDEAIKVESKVSSSLTMSSSMSLSLVIPVANAVESSAETPRSQSKG